MNIAELQNHRRTAHTAYGPVSYLDVGAGRPTVFIHGILTNSLLWRHVITAVASDTRRCIAPDLPGHGHTPPATEGSDVSLTGLAHRIIAFCDWLELEHFDLVANDTGSAVAQIVAAHLPDRLATLTLTNGDTEDTTPPTFFKPIVAMSRPKALGVVGPWLASRRYRIRALLLASYRNAAAIPDDIIDSYGQSVLGTRQGAQAFARLLRALDPEDLVAVRPQLSRLHTPTLILWGTRDIFFPTKSGQRLAELIPGAQGLVTVPGGRLHFPDYRAQELVAHLRTHWNSAA